MVNEISCQELQKWTAESKPFFLLDVREEHEREMFHIGGTVIPMDEVLANHHQIPTNIPVVIYCRKGLRSAIIIQRLQDKFGMTNLYNLKGGLLAWEKQRGQ
jgi:adenylyltransferase/sulfurtransferase